MTTIPRTPRTLKAGIVLLDPVSFKASRVVLLQNTPDQRAHRVRHYRANGWGHRP